MDEARALLTRRWSSDGLVRLPERDRSDEQGAICVRVPIFSVERIAYFERSGRAVLFFLDRAVQPRADAPGAEHAHAPPARQPVLGWVSSASDVGPLFGSPGCAAPDCAPAPAAPSAPLALVCSKCRKPPQPGTTAIEGGTHYLVRHRNDASRPRVDFKRTAACGKWVRAEESPR